MVLLGGVLALSLISGFAAGLTVTTARLTAFPSIALPPKPTDLTISNAGTLLSSAGKPEQGDTVTVTFSRRLAVNSVCSAWSDDSTNKSITAANAVTVQIQNNAASGNDQLAVSVAAASCPTFRFGTVNLGNPNFVTGNVSFSGSGGSASTVQWQVASRRLVVTLGAVSAGGLSVCVLCPGSVTATYTPASGITDTSGTGIIGTASRTGVQF
jgi:hypothetical protein